jgi:hypothetical protein
MMLSPPLNDGLLARAESLLDTPVSLCAAA